MAYSVKTLKPKGGPLQRSCRALLAHSAGRAGWSGARIFLRHIVDTFQPKLQALVYDILPSTTAVFSYAIGSRKLSANEQFFLLVLKQQ